MKLPADKYVLEDYRQDLRTSDAPQVIDTERELLPVKAIGTGIPRPNSRQILHVTLVNVTTATAVQVCTRAAGTRIFFLAAFFYSGAAQATNSALFDATSGNGSAVVANTAYTDDYLAIFTLAAAVGASAFVQLPVGKEIMQGIRHYGGSAAGNANLVVYWVEERV